MIHVEENVGICVPTNSSDFIYMERNVGIHIPTNSSVFIYTERNVGIHIPTYFVIYASQDTGTEKAASNNRCSLYYHVIKSIKMAPP